MSTIEDTRPVRTDARKSFLHAIFTTAMEGGIDYWSHCSEYSWSKGGAGAVIGTNTNIEDLDGFYSVISSSENDWGVDQAYQPWDSDAIAPVWDFDKHMTELSPETELRIDIDVVERGVNLLVDKVVEAAKSERSGIDFSRKYLRKFVVSWLTDGEDGDFDADVADLAIQLGLFGEVVYA